MDDPRHAVSVTQIAQKRRSSDVSIVRRSRPFTAQLRLDRLPALIPIIRALVHVHAGNVVGGAVEREIEVPEGGAESVRQAGPALVVERVRLAEDEGEIVGLWEGGEVGGEVQLFGDGGGGGGVVH